MNKSFKRFISTMLVACMAMSMVASAAGTAPIDTSKDFVQETVDGTLHYFDRDGWRYSVSLLNDGRALFCAVDKNNEDTIYQKFFDNTSSGAEILALENDEDAKIESIANLGFQNLENSEIFNCETTKLNDTRSSDSANLEKLISDLNVRYGADYTNVVKYGSSYNGKSFQIKETQITGADLIDTKLFEAGITIAATLTGLGIGPVALKAVSALTGSSATLSSIIDFTATYTRYGCSTVRMRDAYLSGVNYLINSTWTEYGYIGLGIKERNSPAQLVYDTTSYQHSQSYFNDFAQQVRDAYRNYFG